RIIVARAGVDANENRTRRRVDRVASFPQRPTRAGLGGGGDPILKIKDDGVGACRESLRPSVRPVGWNKEEQRQGREVGRHIVGSHLLRRICRSTARLMRLLGDPRRTPRWVSWAS